MTPEQHRVRHVELHRALDELVADWVRHQGLDAPLLAHTPIMTLMLWSAEQTRAPTDPPER